ANGRGTLGECTVWGLWDAPVHRRWSAVRGETCMRRRRSQIVAMLVLVSALRVLPRQTSALELAAVDDVLARATASQHTDHFVEGQHVLETALEVTTVAAEQQRLRVALADLHFAWARSLVQRFAYREAIPHYQAALATDEQLRRRQAAIDLAGLG